jgi:D-galactarolactone cycloisomerase
MKITSVDVRNVRIPLNDPKTFSTKYITHRDYTLINIRTDDGVEGWAFIWGIPLIKDFIQMVKPLIIDEPAYATIRIFNKIFKAMDRWDRSGIFFRAMSGIDIALWDIIGKCANMPVYKLMGGFREECPAYWSGGYYPDSCKTKEDLFTYLEKEMGQAYDRGFRAFKMKIGGASVAVDLERIATVRKTIGYDCQLMVDANTFYDPETLIAMARKFEQYDLTWVEEPIGLLDDLPNLAHVADRITTPVATGENHFGRWQFRELMEHKACRIIQADATVMGGFTEFLNVAGMCATYGLKMAPHCFHDVQIQLACARPEIIILEYMDAAADVINVQKILDNPVPAVNGMIRPPEGPGHGLILDEKAVQKYLY